jgi:biopolymer transport protein ExbB
MLVKPRSSPIVNSLLLLLLVVVQLTLYAPRAMAQSPDTPVEITQSPAPSETAVDVELAPRGINFLTLLTRGGWFMVPLSILSVLVVVIGVERLIALRRERVFPPGLIRQLGQLSQQPGGLDPRSAYQICQRFPSAASQVLRAMLVKVGRPQTELEHAVSEASQRQATRMSQMVSWLSLAAAVAPLIGLLGTVWGITQAFFDTTQLVAGQNRAEVLAQGIYTALVTTMCGLLIAIPAAVLAHFYENRVITIMNEIEEMIFSLLPQLERYEGKLRFVSDVPHATDEQTPASGDSHDGHGYDLPTPRRKPGRTIPK